MCLFNFELFCPIIWMPLNCILLIQLKWPEDSTLISGEVETEDWWSGLERSAIEAAIFKEAKLEPILATQIAPWIPPMCRGPVQLNSEFQKKSSGTVRLMGCPKKLGALIRRGQYNPLEIQKLSTDKLRDLSLSCDIPVQGLSKVYYCFLGTAYGIYHIANQNNGYL